MKHIIIVGGGISGLYAAYNLSENSNVEVTILEKLSRVGGRIITENQIGRAHV